MEAVKQMTSFYALTSSDKRLLPTHVSLSLAIFYFYYKNGFESPFIIYRKDLMRLAHISSIATYHKCIRELCSYGYISYLPSYDGYKGSQICLKTSGAKKDIESFNGR
jgi:hypothetical protein